jgi:3-deoxy-7-phosphoheptulonate synthase
VYDEASGRGLTLALLGPKGFDEKLSDEFVAMPGVASVARPSRAYRLSSQEFREEPTIVKVRDAVIGGGSLTLMAGPCSIESREQLFEVAAGVAAAGATLLRGGAFKPRTSPYAFQGLGLEGLRLLAEARERTGLPIITEVMEPAQVDMVAEFADVLQIGTRNMQNFSLLNAVGRTRMPVMLKRGLSGTIEEWLLAAEYILAAGNRQVILCERGIRTFETAARNTLDLNAVPILRRLTHLPVIVDPSHATGKRWMVAPMSYAGVAAGADGVMVEVHPKPEEAWSDGEQSLTLPMFSRLAGELRTIHSVVSPMHANPGEASGR